MSTVAAVILANLKKIAPDISFKTTWTPDPNFRWDGDGPDPAEEGYQAYDVDVFARAIVNGEIVEGRNSLGGSYSTPGEHDPDIHGYLPQMLEEATAELQSQVRGDLAKQAKAARQYLTQAMRIRARYSGGQSSRRRR
jgi:hypothetical protein